MQGLFSYDSQYLQKEMKYQAMLSQVAYNNKGLSALHHSCFLRKEEARFSRQEEITRLLINGGAIIDAVNKDGVTPLMGASSAGNDKLLFPRQFVAYSL